MNKYRDRLQIIADILTIASRRARKTQIMYQANLSYRLLCRYLKETADSGLVCLEEDVYVLTTRGRKFLAQHEAYSKRCKRLEQRVNHVNHEKTVLENFCSNGNNAKGNLNHSMRNTALEKKA
jgi:predicted transcriptional regulator